MEQQFIPAGNLWLVPRIDTAEHQGESITRRHSRFRYQAERTAVRVTASVIEGPGAVVHVDAAGVGYRGQDCDFGDTRKQAVEVAWRRAVFARDYCLSVGSKKAA